MKKLDFSLHEADEQQRLEENKEQGASIASLVKTQLMKLSRTHEDRCGYLSVSDRSGMVKAVFNIACVHNVQLRFDTLHLISYVSH